MNDKLVWFWGNKLSVYLIVIGRRTQDSCLFSDEGLHYVIQTSLSVCPYWTSLKSLCTCSPTSSRLTHYRPCPLGRSTPQYWTPQRSTRHWRRPACCWHSALVHRDSANIPTTACLTQWMGGCLTVMYRLVKLFRTEWHESIRVVGNNYTSGVGYAKTESSQVFGFRSSGTWRCVFGWVVADVSEWRVNQEEWMRRAAVQSERCCSFGRSCCGYIELGSS
jgi:hypothetical protein